MVISLKDKEFLETKRKKMPKQKLLVTMHTMNDRDGKESTPNIVEEVVLAIGKDQQRQRINIVALVKGKNHKSISVAATNVILGQSTKPSI